MKQQVPLTFTNGRLVLPKGVQDGALRCVDNAGLLGHVERY